MSVSCVKNYGMWKTSADTAAYMVLSVFQCILLLLFCMYLDQGTKCHKCKLRQTYWDTHTH